MERSYDERVVLYFYKKNTTSSLLMLILGFGIISVGINRADSHIFVTIGALFGAMAVWMWIRQKYVRITGEEVDASVEKFFVEASIYANAFKEFNIEEEDIKGLEKLILRGYSPIGINTEPLFRWDNEDGKARSSNYQATLFIIDETVMFTYSQAKSLVDSEFFEGGRVWRYKAITDCEIKDIPKLCMTAPENEESKIEQTFSILLITGENKESYGFAFDDEWRTTAEYINDCINRKIRRENRMRKPKTPRHEVRIDATSLSRREKESIEIGFIGEEIE